MFIASLLHSTRKVGRTIKVLQSMTFWSYYFETLYGDLTMQLRNYLKDLDEAGFEAFAKRADTSTKYLKVHVIGGSRGASLKFMRALARASEGNVSFLEVLEHYGVSKKELEVA